MENVGSNKIYSIINYFFTDEKKNSYEQNNFLKVLNIGIGTK